ncbi:MAG: lysozyme inhibitor LprI family protein [Sulfurimonas sp.]|nr:lysozyme inhibitor LprI family protein [Sulfurimonas sp.]
MKSYILMILIFTSLCSNEPPKYCNSDTTHTIDIWLAKEMKKLDSNPMTLHWKYNDLVSESFTKWDAQLNRTYKLFRGKLNSTDKRALLIAQRAWLKFYSAELALEGSLSRNSGQMGALNVLLKSIKLTRKRNCQLLKYSEEWDLFY